MEYHPTHFERDTADEPVAHDARGRVAPEPDQSTVATPEDAAGSDDAASADDAAGDDLLRS